MDERIQELEAQRKEFQRQRKQNRDELRRAKSKEKKPNQIFSFAKPFKKSKVYKPMVAVPSTYSKTY